MENIINSPLLWFLCSITIVIVAFQGIAYFRLATKNAKRLNIPKQTCQKAFRVGMITAIGPALGILIVMVGLMAVLGNPLTWMRLSIIVSATNELAAAKIGAEAAGVDFGSIDYTKEALMVSWFGMWLNGVGSLLAVVLFASHLEKIRTKVVNKNPKILAVVSGAAMCAIYGNLSSGTIMGGGGHLGAWLFAGITTIILYKMSLKIEKIKEYSLGIAMIVGTLAGAIIHASI